MMVRYSLRLPITEYDSLKAFAKRNGVSMSEIMRRAIALFIARHKERAKQPGRATRKSR
jgi:hypothetical protein